ncbi:MAG: hypothetical protein KKE96_03560, partial [Candidatus Altiarchaeota archaeon]|nr:hypothetical protein [Candidatus Altiarchaeota archaeon]
MPKTIPKKTKDKIKSKLEEGYTGKELANDYGVSPQFISGLKKEIKEAEKARQIEAKKRQEEEKELTIQEKIDKHYEWEQLKGRANWLFEKIEESIKDTDSLMDSIDRSSFIENNGHARWEASALKGQFEVLDREI